MESFAKFLSALSSLAWPAIVLLLLYKFQKPLARVIESATGRKFSIKVGKTELTMEEASEQQRKIISDIQMKIAELETRLRNMPSFTGLQIDSFKGFDIPSRVLGKNKAAGLDLEGAVRPEALGSMGNGQDESVKEFPTPHTETFTGAERILWVDDKPKNNSYLVASLEDRGIRVDTARSSDEGIKKFKAMRYDCVVSDMGRPEGDMAGIDLVKRIRDMDPDIPYFIYCGSWAAQNWRKQALKAGVTEITSSGTTLLGFLTAPVRKAPAQSATP